MLVVDDDVLVRTWLERELRSSGHEPLIAAGAREAIDIARRTPPALALIDQRMPGLDGVATFSALLAEQPNLNAYLFTGFVLSASEIDRALRAGFLGYLQKPLEPEAFRTWRDT